MTKDFETKLRQYADVLVRVGANVQPGKRLVITAPVTDDPATRRLIHYATESAYQAGARFVEVIWDDASLKRIRMQHAPEGSFTEITAERFELYADVYAEDSSRLIILDIDPDLFQGGDPARVATMNATREAHMLPVRALSSKGYGTWSIGSAATALWADKMLPELPPEERLEELWNLIFASVHIDKDDPVSALRSHAETLGRRAEQLTQKAYTELHYRAPGTDLKIGLPPQHIWLGGSETSHIGVVSMPNLPTEEVFTIPHRLQANGTVRASKPLNYDGLLIDDFSLTFKDGKVVDFLAETGADHLQHLLEMDEGSSRLGEVALVPHSSPISQTGRLFYESLFDENASCHIALGRAFSECIVGGAELSIEEFVQKGGNMSLAHVDFMIGSDQMDIDGVTADGKVEPVMRGGEWALAL